MVEEPEVNVEAGLEKGIVEFNDEAFFECHDTLEEVWMEVRGQERLFFQGLVQVAVGYYHLTCENYPAQSTCLSGDSEAGRVSAVPAGVNLADLVARRRRRWRRCWRSGREAGGVRSGDDSKDPESAILSGRRRGRVRGVSNEAER